MPDQLIPGCKGNIGLEPLAVPADLTGGEPLAPHLGCGVAIAGGVKGADQPAPIPKANTVAVGMAPIQPSGKLGPQG